MAKELYIEILGDKTFIWLDGEQIAYGNLVQESFTKVGVIEEYKFIIEEGK